MEVRLSDGPTPQEGRVEFRYNNGDWSTVCDDFFQIEEANVVCKMLGYTEAIDYYNADDTTAGAGADTVPIILDDIICRGDETSILECSHNGIGVHNCGHYEDIAVRCKVPGRLFILIVLK